MRVVIKLVMFLARFVPSDKNWSQVVSLMNLSIFRKKKQLNSLSKIKDLFNVRTICSTLLFMLLSFGNFNGLEEAKT